MLRGRAVGTHKSGPPDACIGFAVPVVASSLDELRNDTNETANLVVPAGAATRVHVDQPQSTQFVRMPTAPSDVYVIYAAAAAMGIMAFSGLYAERPESARQSTHAALLRMEVRLTRQHSQSLTFLRARRETSI